jgi:hypothetical protein
VAEVSVNEEAAAQDYLVEYLEADPTLADLLEGGVWLRSVAESARFPVVKIDKQEASDLMVVGLHRVWADLLFLVRGVVHWKGSGQPDWTQARAIGDQLDTLLHDHEAITAELQVHSFREESWTDETIETGDLYLHCGGMYRMRARAV